MQKLLCVDDEQFILSALQRLFKSQYEVLTAGSGQAAVKLLEQTPVDVVISDQRMPGMTGVDLFKHIRETSPSTMRVLLTGYADLPATIEAVNSGEVFRYVTKPWNNDSLRMTVALAMRAAQRTSALLPPAAAQGLEIRATVAAREAAPAAVAKSAVAAPAPAHTSGMTNFAPEIEVLVLDGDPGVFALVREQLGGERLSHGAHGLEQAADLLESRPQIGVLITEARIGNDDLVHVLATLRSVRPSLVTIVASRLADAQLVIKLINQGQIYRYIGKPLNPDKLRTELSGAIRRHSLLRNSPTLNDRHVAEVVKPVQESIERNQHAGGGLRALFARVANLFR
jgi:response regulator RpfG family c-di-GMP phosphodiesterase